MKREGRRAKRKRAKLRDTAIERALGRDLIGAELIEHANGVELLAIFQTNGRRYAVHILREHQGAGPLIFDAILDPTDSQVEAFCYRRKMKISEYAADLFAAGQYTDDLFGLEPTDELLEAIREVETLLYGEHKKVRSLAIQT